MAGQDSPALERMRTLIVDDEPCSRLITVAALKGRGHQITSFENAEEAWEACQEESFDLAILDWMLPGMDGLELCRRLRSLQWGDQVLILVVTTRDQPEDLRAVLAAGADDYLAKPITPALLDVRMIIAKHRLINRQQRLSAEAALREAHDELEERVAERTADLETTVAQLAEEAAEREHAVLALGCSEEKYRRLIENINDVVYSLDSDGRVAFISPAVERVLGYSQNEVEGRSIQDFVHPDDLQNTLGHLDLVLTGESTQNEFRLAASDGRMLLVHNSSRSLWEDGCVVGVTGVFSDVTERKALEDRLRLAQRMEVLGKFASGIAHDFSNLTMVLESTATTALRRTAADDPLRTELELISRTSRRAADLSRSVLAFSRKQVMELEKLNLNDLIDDVLPMIERLMPAEIKIRFIPGVVPGGVQVDRTGIDRVIMNLCINSRDAMPDGGQVVIETGTKVLERGDVEGHPHAHEGRFAFLMIRDTGVGMTPEALDQAFDPFFTTKETGEGSGLGLAAVYTTIEQHGGLVEFESSPEAGTTCLVFLPATELRPVAAATSEEAPAVGEEETILMVEDFDDLREVLVGFLDSLGYRTLAAPDGIAALDILRDEAAVELVVTDLSMPRMGGLELYQQSKKIQPNLAFLFCSGHAMDWEQLKDLPDPGIEFLQKPFDTETFSRKIRHILDRARTLPPASQAPDSDPPDPPDPP